MSAINRLAATATITTTEHQPRTLTLRLRPPPQPPTLRLRPPVSAQFHSLVQQMIASPHVSSEVREELAEWDLRFDGYDQEMKTFVLTYILTEYIDADDNLIEFEALLRPISDDLLQGVPTDQFVEDVYAPLDGAVISIEQEVELIEEAFHWMLTQIGTDIESWNDEQVLQFNRLKQRLLRFDRESQELSREMGDRIDALIQQVNAIGDTRDNQTSEVQTLAQEIKDDNRSVLELCKQFLDTL